MTINTKTLLVVSWLALWVGAASATAQEQDVFEEALREANAENEAAMTRQQIEDHVTKTYFNGMFAIDDANPVASVPSMEEANANPVDYGNLINGLIERGNAAVKRGDHEAAARYFLALARATPDGSLAFRRLCEAYRAAGKHSEAVQACDQALTRNGVTLDDYVQLVQLIVTQPNELSAERVARVDQVIEHLAAQSGTPRALVPDLQCRLGARILDATRLQACTDALRRLDYPAASMSTYVWALAVLHNDKAEAQRQLELARAAGVDSSTLAGMAQAMSTSTDRFSGMRSAALLLMAAVLCALGFGYVQKWTARRARA